jgi:hypothetical protein
MKREVEYGRMEFLERAQKEHPGLPLKKPGVIKND